jgi:methyl-accepting chemotaxis protein
MKFTLGRKLGLAFALVLAVMACSSGLTYWKVSDMRSQEDLMINVRIPSLTYSLDLIAHLNQASNKAREYILMADDPETAFKSKSDWEDEEKAIEVDAQKLKEVSSRFVLQANKDRVSTLSERTAESYRSMGEIFRIRKPNNPASALAASNFMSTTVTPYNGVTRKTAQDLVDSLQQLFAAEAVKMEAAASSAILMLLVTTLLAIVIGCFAAIFISRRITDNVNKILQRAKAVAAGDLSGKPLEPTTQDEIAELELAMNDMTGSLRVLVGNISGGVQTLGASATQLSVTRSGCKSRIFCKASLPLAALPTTRP